MTTDEPAEAAHTFDALNISYFVFYCSSVLVLPSYTLLVNIANIPYVLPSSFIYTISYHIICIDIPTYDVFNCPFRYIFIFSVNHCDFEKKDVLEH